MITAKFENTLRTVSKAHNSALEYRTLSKLNDRLLNDIGIARADIDGFFR